MVMEKFDFFAFLDAILDSDRSTVEKLLSIVLLRHSGTDGGDAFPSRARMAKLASCSLPTMKRAQAGIKLFFESEERTGRATVYRPKITVGDVEQAVNAIRATGYQGDTGSGCQNDTGSPQTGSQNDTDPFETRYQNDATPGIKMMPHNKALKEVEEKELSNDSSQKAAPKPKAKGRAGKTRLPADWVMPLDWRARSKSKFGVTDAQLDFVAERFRTYWTGKDAKHPMKADWLATWENWLYREVQNGIRLPQAINGHPVYRPRPQTFEEIRQSKADDWLLGEAARIMESAGAA